MSTAVAERQPEALETKALTWSERASSLKVRDAATYTMACDTLTAVKALRKEAEEHHRPVIQSAHETHRKACDALNRVDRPLAEAEAILKRGIGAWEIEQKRIEEQRQREAREAAERLLAEQREAEIEAAEADGATVEEVTAMVEAPMVVPVAKVQPTYQRATGVSTAVTYRAEVIDIKKLARAVADGVVPHTLITANSSALNALARAQKGVMQIPGVRVVEDSIVRARG